MRSRASAPPTARTESTAAGSCRPKLASSVGWSRMNPSHCARLSADSSSVRAISSTRVAIGAVIRHARPSRSSTVVWAPLLISIRST